MLEKLVRETEQDCAFIFKQIQEMVESNQHKMLTAFQRQEIGDHHFNSTDGYGYDDIGRDRLEALYADVFGAEDALVRPQLISGTHAIATALFSLLLPGDELVYITGSPYDTLEEVIGKRGQESGSLKDLQVAYKEIDLLANGKVDYPAIKETLSKQTKVIGIQRSKGYADRPSFTIHEIEEMVQFVKQLYPHAIVFVDNCYGEFVEDKEPLEAGADVIAGSLIKNPGGGLVRAGGYIAGREVHVAKAANRLTAPGLGKETGATLQMLQEMYQGFFFAPHVVGESLKGAVFTARLLDKLGVSSVPAYDEMRTDLIQSITFHDKEKMIAFCQLIQANSPINSYVAPYPSEMPGYDEEVIMAAGTFIQGASIELSIDGPIKSPYIAFMQGGLTYAHVKIAITNTMEKMISDGLIDFPA